MGDELDMYIEWFQNYVKGKDTEWKLTRDELNKKVREVMNREQADLKCDLAAAIGHMRGCGHTYPYLESRYPEWHENPTHTEGGSDE